MESGARPPPPLEGAAPPRPASTRGRRATPGRRHHRRGHGPGRPQRSRAAAQGPRDRRGHWVPQGEAVLGSLPLPPAGPARAPSGRPASGPAGGSIAASNPGSRPDSHGGRRAARACCGAHSDPETTSPPPSLPGCEDGAVQGVLGSGCSVGFGRRPWTLCHPEAAAGPLWPRVASPSVRALEREEQF